MKSADVQKLFLESRSNSTSQDRCKICQIKVQVSSYFADYLPRLKNHINTFLEYVTIISNFITKLWQKTRTQTLHFNFHQSKLTLKS